MMRQNTIAVFAIAATSILFGCETKTPITPEEAATFADAWAPTVEPTLLERTEGASIGRELKTLIEAAAAREEANSQRKEPPYDVFVREVYEGFEFKPQLVQQGKLTASGQAVWTNLQTIGDHVIDVEPYHIAEITTSLEALKSAAAGSKTGDLVPNDAEKAWVVAWLAGRNHEDFQLEGDAAQAAATDALVAAAEGSRLNAAMKEHEEFGAKLAKETAQLEWTLAHDWLKFSRDIGFRHVRNQFLHQRHDDFYNDPEIRRANERPPDALGAYKAGVLWRRAARVAESMRDETRILHAGIRRSLVDVISSKEPEKTAAAIWPSHPQYKALLTEHKRYKAIVEAGGWDTVAEKKRLKVGSRDSTVTELKKRLQVEGFYPPGELNNRYDDTLKEAIIAYQRTHQMEVTGEPHRTFWRSLNVPAKRRLDQIAINVKRWRYTNIAHDTDETYVYVNIPDFTAELWDKQKREMRFAIVVGNNELVEDQETQEKEHANRTPFPIAAFIDRAIYNPFWNVTPRVRTNEILPEVKKWVEASYERKRLKKIAEEKKYEVLRAALQGKKPAPANTTTFASTNLGGTPAVTTTPKPAAAATEESTKPKGLTAESFAAFAANPEEYPYYNAETGEIDVSTTIPGNVPGWYAENNYEVMYPSKKWEYVRMTPGDHNALGRVKVIFPNLHDVYLHDTNAKPLFQRDIRAFSHGCMRMSKPLEFAEYLLRRDGLYEEQNIPKVLSEGSYPPVFLKRQVPVFVEYRTVRVDDEGRANFLSDIYDIDEQGIIVPKTSNKKTAAAP